MLLSKYSMRISRRDNRQPNNSEDFDCTLKYESTFYSHNMLKDHFRALYSRTRKSYFIKIFFPNVFVPLKKTIIYRSVNK